MKWRGVNSWPDTLVVHLVRWLDSGDKNNVEVTAALEEKLDAVTYELMALCEHQGESPHSGHYVAYTLCNDDLFLCDDSEVSIASEGSVLGAEPYVLIFQKLP